MTIEQWKSIGLDDDICGAIGGALAQYIPLELNTDGANGRVVFARNSVTQSEVAIKFHDSDGGAGRHDEPRLLNAVRSPNVLQVFDAGVLSETLAYFVTPRCDGGSLEGLIGGMVSARRALALALGIARGIAAIHEKAMVHRDLKPGNVVVSGGEPMIADFGSVRAIPYAQSSRVVSMHTVLYRPPEVDVGAVYGIQGDIYQLGIITFELLGGRLGKTAHELLGPRELRALRKISDPYDASRFLDDRIQERARRGSLLDVETLPRWVVPSAIRAIRRMTSPDPARRPATAAGAIGLLHQAHVEQGDWLRIPGGAELSLADRSIRVVLDPRSGLYVIEQDRGAGYRKIPGSPIAAFGQQVAWVSSSV